jgi:hypothetical protein
VQLHRPENLASLSALGARILIVSFAPREVLGDWVRYFQDSILGPALVEAPRPGVDPFRLTRFASDPDLAAYHAFGLGRLSRLVVYGPRILLQYRRWAEEGRTIQRNTEDKLQRGGDFVIDRQGRVAFAHTGRDQADRPPVKTLLRALGNQH